MTELSPRQQLLKEISDELQHAIDSDLEHGVAVLNRAASAEFDKKYPSLSAFVEWIHFMYYDEVPLD